MQRLAAKSILPFFLLFIISITVSAQVPPNHPAGEIRLALEKLKVLGSVLYIAAHPDDENTRLITYFSKHKKYRTAYLSLTRGDGGQNLIGPEIRESLGIIRTQELLSARRIDGGQQFFSRANDFGYSKHPDETFNVWDREKVLADVVWTIRKFKPDVIITRFSKKPGTTHGHHTASAILADEAFKLAADPSSFPEQLEFVEPWQPKKIFWNTSSWFYRNKENFDDSKLTKIDVGKYNPLLGQSYTEIAAKSRSQHRSQGFGAAGSRGQTVEYLEQWHGPDTKTDVFEKINTTWQRITKNQEIEELINKAISKFEETMPHLIVPELINIRQAITSLPESHWRQIKLEEVNQLVKACLGLFIETSIDQETVSHGDSVFLDFEAINRSSVDVKLITIEYPEFGISISKSKELSENIKVAHQTKSVLPEDIPISQPYWLKTPGTEGMYAVPDQQLIGLPENPEPLNGIYTVQIKEELFQFEYPIIYKETDPARGEIYSPLKVIPEVMMKFQEKVIIFPDQNSQEISVLVKAGKDSIQGNLSLSTAPGWQISPESMPFAISTKNEEHIYTFEVTPPGTQVSSNLSATAKIGDNRYNSSWINIDYEHIPSQLWFPEASTRIVKINIQKEGELIGYIEGAGDAIPQSLIQLGYQVEYLTEQQLNNGSLAQYDAIITGIRAYNTNEKLPFYQKKLWQYVENGGTLLVQYNTSYRMLTEEIAPYHLKISRDRVTVEEAPVKILAAEHPVLKHPNKISEEDFRGWVQERGLYFSDEWDKKFTPILSSHDPGEDAKEGGLLVANYGKGYFIYTGYSWFRQLPAGVPGAYRIFTNLISLGNQN